MKGWKYLFDYHGQNPSYCEPDDLPVDVEVYGRGNNRRAIDKASGKVEFTYTVYLENFRWHLKEGAKK